MMPDGRYRAARSLNVPPDSSNGQTATTTFSLSPKLSHASYRHGAGNNLYREDSAAYKGHVGGTAGLGPLNLGSSAMKVSANQGVAAFQTALKPKTLGRNVFLVAIFLIILVNILSVTEYFASDYYTVGDATDKPKGLDSFKALKLLHQDTWTKYMKDRKASLLGLESKIVSKFSGSGSTLHEPIRYDEGITVGGVLYQGEEDGIERFEHQEALENLEDTDPFKQRMLKDEWMFRDDKIIHRSDAAIKLLADYKALHTDQSGETILPAEARFFKGVLYGVSAGVKVKKMNRKSQQEVFDTYMQEIIRSANSLRKALTNQEIGIGLVVDVDMDMIPADYRRPFDYIIYNDVTKEAEEHDTKGIGWIIKLLIMLHTPFSQTLYVDGDTLFCSDPSEAFDSLKFSMISMSKDVRTKRVETLRGQNLDFNAGVIAYRKASSIVILMREIIRILLRNRLQGDQFYWGHELERFNRYGNVRYHMMSPRFHFQPCRTDRANCVVDGPVVLLHGRCWLTVKDPSPRDFCDYINSNYATRLVHTDCTKLRIFRIEADKIADGNDTASAWFAMEPVRKK